MIASIVVLTYNHLETGTIPCVESVLRHTRPGEYELILVDNASSDDTPAYLVALAREHPHVRIVLNRANLGYAAGNNAGIRRSNGDIIVLLNNDTEVTPGWLPRLIEPFQRLPDVGLVGPITNSAGNCQKIRVPGSGPGRVSPVVRRYTQSHRFVWVPSPTLIFFCVAIHRKVMARVGLLDPGYGVGLFEDNDYCERVRRAGYRILVHHGCYVYHQGSLSFGKLAHREHTALFERNRARFLGKFPRYQRGIGPAALRVQKLTNKFHRYVTNHPAVPALLKQRLVSALPQAPGPDPPEDRSESGNDPGSP